MKIVLGIAMMLPFFAHSQCTNVYGRRVDCPTIQDSIVLYNNAVKVQEFFDNSKIYAKTRTVKIVNEDEKRDIFNKLQQARSIFVMIRNEKLNSAQEDKFASTKPNPNYKDITYRDYYHEIDEYRFYQRELENQIVNKESPTPIYDNRVCPVVINEYKCLDSTSVFFGDIVNIPLYIPVIVKPASMLTSAEKITREEILKNDYNIPSPPKKEKQVAKAPAPVKVITQAPQAIVKTEAPSLPIKKATIEPIVTTTPEIVKTEAPSLPIKKAPVETVVITKPEILKTELQSIPVKQLPVVAAVEIPVATKPEPKTIAAIASTTVEKPILDRKGLPVYYFNGAGSGSIIGFMNNGNFRKVRKEEYQELMVMKYAQDLLENEDRFKTWLRIQYGGYCVAVR